jgi:hypothetical protein
MNDAIDLKLLYYGHSRIEMALLKGALESEAIPHVERREVGLAEQAPSIFFTPATEVKLYVAAVDWVRAEALARRVLGEEWDAPTEE